MLIKLTSQLYSFPPKLKLDVCMYACVYVEHEIWCTKRETRFKNNLKIVINPNFLLAGKLFFATTPTCGGFEPTLRTCIGPLSRCLHRIV